MEFINILEEFLQDETRVNKNTVYNEASLQHELGCYLKEKSILLNLKFLCVKLIKHGNQVIL